MTRRYLPRPRRAHPAVIAAFAALLPVTLLVTMVVSPQPAAATLAAWGVVLITYLGIAGLAVRQRTWIDGTVLAVRSLRTRTVDLSRAEKLALRPDHTGNAVLTASGGAASGSTGSVYLHLLTLNGIRTSAQPAWVCRALVDALRDNPLPIATPIAQLLRAQADHLDAGGAPEDSPLRPLTSPALLAAAGTTAAVAAITSLLS